jgi:DNA-binding HxlR family transcriptional regulator
MDVTEETKHTQQRKEACAMTRQKKTTVCPLGGGGVGGKWKFWIMYHLLSGPKRFGELQRLFPQVSRQMLTIQLRELEQTGILHRQVYLQVPPKVEYRLSEVGQRLEPIMRQMDAWGKGYSEQGEQEVDWLISLGGRWTFWIWYHLLSGPKRFGELQKLLSPISQHMLILKLRELERMGVLARHASVPKSLKVEYTLTQLGQNTEPLLHQIYAWGRWACDQLGLAYDGPVMDEGVEYAHHA